MDNIRDKSRVMEGRIEKSLGSDAPLQALFVETPLTTLFVVFGISGARWNIIIISFEPTFSKLFVSEHSTTLIEKQTANWVSVAVFF